MNFVDLLDRAVARILPEQLAGACIPYQGCCCRKTPGGPLGSLGCAGQCYIGEPCGGPNCPK